VVACLLAAVDTQDDGFYFEIRAFGFGMEFTSWCVREGFVTSLEGLAQILWQDEYRDADGNEYRVRLAIHDAMGHRTSEVYDFCRNNRGRIIPAKGEQRLAQPHAWTNLEFYPGTKKQIPGGLKLLRHDTNYYKNELSRRLEVVNGDPGCWHYHAETTVDWARQMTVEGRDEQDLWQNPGNKPNHAWDCAELLLVAHDMLGVKHWKAPEKKKAEPVSSRSVEKQEEKHWNIQNGGGGKWLR
jgi:phage terminase large subunit GpA-like protein